MTDELNNKELEEILLIGLNQVDMDVEEKRKLVAKILHSKETSRLVDVHLEIYKEKIENGDAETNCDDIKFREVVKVLKDIKFVRF